MLRLVPLLAATAAASPSSPSPAPASMAFEVTASAGGPWKLVATNTGDETLRFAADARLLRLEVTPPPEAPKPGSKLKPKAPKMVECRLPADFRPSDVRHDRAALLEPGQRWEEAFDPALYCFGAKEREALVPGASVIVKLGFPAPAPKIQKGKAPPPPAPPHVAAPTALEPAVHGLKELVAEAITLAEDPSADPAPSSPSQPAPAIDPDPGAPKLSVSTASHLDAASERSIVLKATVRNVGKRSMLVHLRRDQLFFDVEGPTGLYRCGPSDALRAVPPDFFTSFAPGKTRAFELRLMEACPNGAFSRPGLYRVRAGAFVTDGGADPKLGAWEGTAIAEETTLIRVRTGERPFYVTPPMVTSKDASISADQPH